LPTPPSPLPLLLITPPPPYTISQHGSINYKLLTQQQQEQLATLQVQLQALLTAQREGRGRGVSTEVAKPQVFDGTSRKISGFITACKLYIRMKIRGVAVEEQI